MAVVWFEFLHSFALFSPEFLDWCLPNFQHIQCRLWAL